MARKPRPGQPEGPGTSILDRDRMLTPEELADFCGVEVSTTDQWASRGGGPDFHKVGKHRRYHPADVREWLKTRRRSAASGTTGQPDAA